MKKDKNGQRINTGPIPNYFSKKAYGGGEPAAWNARLTHRVTTVMREAFENGLRHWAWKYAGVRANQTIEKVGNSLAHNAGVNRRPDVSVNVTTKTWQQLKQLKAV